MASWWEKDEELEVGGAGRGGATEVAWLSGGVAMANGFFCHV